MGTWSGTLTVNANGGIWDGTSPQTIAIGVPMAIENPIKAGYVFNGWTVAGEGSSFEGATSEFTLGGENATIKANWFLKEKEFAYIPPIDNTDSPYHLFTVPATGWYQIETWGAGGGINNSNPSAGGYSSGKIQLTEGEKLYIYVGGKGISCSIAGACLASGGYNGGGYAFYSNQYTAGGGGATDIRYFTSTPTTENLTWDNSVGLNNRIMVAGGGGGNGLYNGTDIGSSGHGGGLIGIYGKDSDRTTINAFNGDGGTQITGGVTYYKNGSISTVAKGVFGRGGQYSTAIECCGNNGGGGGYYGGGASSRGHGGGGGGSSYISGYAGVVSGKMLGDNFIEPSALATNSLEYNTRHYSGKYFVDGEMQSGVNEENVKAKITFISFNEPERINTKLNQVRYIKDCMTGTATYTGNAYWTEIEAIRNGTNVAYGKTVKGTNALNSYHSLTYNVLTNGKITGTEVACSNEISDLKCVVVDLGEQYNLDELSIWHLQSETANNNTTYVSSDNFDAWTKATDSNFTWTPVIQRTAVETSQGKRVSAYSID